MDPIFSTFAGESTHFSTNKGVREANWEGGRRLGGGQMRGRANREGGTATGWETNEGEGKSRGGASIAWPDALPIKLNAGLPNGRSSSAFRVGFTWLQWQNLSIKFSSK